MQRASSKFNLLRKMIHSASVAASLAIDPSHFEFQRAATVLAQLPKLKLKKSRLHKSRVHTDTHTSFL